VSRRLRPRGLRARIVVGFAVGTLLVSAVLVTTTFVLARNYLLDQRESSITRQAFADANLLRSRLSTAGVEVGDTLADLFPAGGSAAGGSAVVVRKGDAWYSSSLDVGPDDVPGALQDVVASGAAGRVRSDSADGPRLVVGVGVPAAAIEFYEVAPLTELQLDPLANTGVDPLDNGLATQVADFKPVGTNMATDLVTRGGALADLPVAGPLAKGLLP